MTAPPLDHTSRRILQLLAGDGRVSYQAIADEIGLSRPAVMERVKRLATQEERSRHGALAIPHYRTGPGVGGGTETGLWWGLHDLARRNQELATNAPFLAFETTHLAVQPRSLRVLTAEPLPLPASGA